MSEANENTGSSVTKLTLRRNGSILVEGKVEIIGPDGETIECKEKFALCRCGESKNKPFCDGAHKQCGFDSNPV